MSKNAPMVVDCPYDGCNEKLVAEITAPLSDMSETEQDELLSQVRKRLTTAIKKHHKDGHPKEG